MKPDEAKTYFEQGNVFKQKGMCNEALASYDKAIALKPHPYYFLNKGNTLRDMRRLNEALESYDLSISLDPNFSSAYNSKGATLRDLRRGSEALACFDKALACDPKSVGALVNRGNLLREMNRLDDAVRDYDRALALKPDFDFLEGMVLHTRMHLCDWKDYDAATAKLVEKVRKGLPATISFPFLALPSAPGDQLQCAKIFTARQYPPMPAVWKGELYQHKKIRLAYVSSDLFEHATAYLAAGVFEKHDKAKFETVALSFGPDEKSGMLHRLVPAFDAFIDVREKSDETVARLIREKEIDILVDLKGHTQNGRAGIFARRPAPVQVNYLGYPGTMGAPYIDYIIADPVIIPEGAQAAYLEKVAYLPDSYQPNDDKREIAATPSSRAEVGLPEKAFIFCTFNGSYKITPDVFKTWMRLLQQVDGSVLWLLQPGKGAAHNLQAEAQKHGVEPERIIYAPYMKLNEHLARLRLADLFLDTLPCNAHTTASDALWAGLPLLTCAGETFASRVAASLLTAAGMPELITHSLEDYEQLALKIARDPALLAALKKKLVSQRATCALFDTARYTRNLEAAYVKMWQRQQQGLAPATIEQ